MVFFFLYEEKAIQMESLKKNSDFQNVYKKGKSKANRQFVMMILPNDSERNRIGIAVSKKVGNSVVRHRVARLIRESIRLNEQKMYTGYDIVLTARRGAADADYHQVYRSIMHLAGLHRILKEE